jgi:hypothetical protein
MNISAISQHLRKMKIEIIRNWWEAQTIFTPSLDTKITASVFEILDKNKIVDAYESEKN